MTIGLFKIPFEMSTWLSVALGVACWFLPCNSQGLSDDQGVCIAAIRLRKNAGRAKGERKEQKPPRVFELRDRTYM